MIEISFHSDEHRHFLNGYPVQAFTYRDYAIDMHSHGFYEINIVLSGSGFHRIQECRFPVRRGDVFVIPPMVAHAYEDTRSLDVYHILLHRDFIARNRAEASQVKGFLQLTEIEPFLRSSFPGSYFLHLSQSDLEHLEGELPLIDDNGPFPWEDHAPMKQHALWKILYWFSSLLYTQIYSGKRGKQHRYEAQILRALEYIHRHFGEKITIDTLREPLYLSRSTFLRAFNDICGMSPTDYLSRYRCRMAAEMLRQGELTRTEIAQACGFYDLSHMHRQRL